MYLLSYYEDRDFVEASLGGIISTAELQIFEEELLEVIDGLGGRPFNLMLDYSRAKFSDANSHDKLNHAREKCLQHGAARIVSVVPGQSDIERETAYRLEAVLQGYEDYVLDPAYAQFTSLASNAVIRKAA